MLTVKKAGGLLHLLMEEFKVEGDNMRAEGIPLGRRVHHSTQELDPNS